MKNKLCLFLIFILLVAVQVQAMAVTYYLSPSGGNFGNASTWASVSGGSDSVGVPDSTIDVVADPNSGSATLTVNTSSVCKNLNFTGFTGTFNLNNILTVSGDIIFSSSANYACNNINNYYLAMGSNTLQTITSNGAVLNFDIAMARVGNNISLQDELNLGVAYLGLNNSGTFNTNNYNVTCGKIIHTTPVKITFTAGSSIITTKYLDFSSTGLTFNYDTSTVIVNQSATGTMSFSHGTAQFYNLTLNGHASTGCYKAFAGNLTVNNILTIAGNSSINKLALKSNDTTVRTITAPTVNLSNIDYYQNVKGAGDGWIGKVPFFNSSSTWNPNLKYSGILR